MSGFESGEGVDLRSDCDVPHTPAREMWLNTHGEVTIKEPGTTTAWITCDGSDLMEVRD